MGGIALEGVSKLRAVTQGLELSDSSSAGGFPLVLVPLRHEGKDEPASRPPGSALISQSREGLDRASGDALGLGVRIPTPRCQDVLPDQDASLLERDLQTIRQPFGLAIPTGAF